MKTRQDVNDNNALHQELSLAVNGITDRIEPGLVLAGGARGA